jgi:putative FmdB family regulatory protein
MPIFEYVCRDCDHRFETIVRGDAVPTCPSCSGRELEKQLSVFAVSTRTAPGPASSRLAPCGSCGDPRGPGACSLN